MSEEAKQDIFRKDSNFTSSYASELAMEASRRRERLRSMRDRLVAPALAAKSNSTNLAEEVSEPKNEDKSDERPVAAYVYVSFQNYYEFYITRIKLPLKTFLKLNFFYFRPLFRNYTPRDEELKSLKRAKLDPADGILFCLICYKFVNIYFLMFFKVKTPVQEQLEKSEPKNLVEDLVRI